MLGRVVVCMLGLLVVPGIASADTISFSPTPVDLWDLDHGWVYEWGINYSLPAGEVIESAELSFDNIRNWDNSPNDLYVYLMDTVSGGASRFSDSNNNGDSFAPRTAVANVMLEHYSNLPSSAQDINYSFSADEIVALNSFVLDGNFGIGFDPDCHFYNSGIQLSITTIPDVPEPASLGLLGMGGLAVIRRRK